KEIGVRKVLGASVAGITRLLTVDFLKLVTTAAVLSFPVSWYLMDQWLEDFAYRTNIDWTIFALAGVIAVVIAFITISVQALRAATANPVKSLRTE
ncbi:MAG TPA: ABC transporter permease, partial [Catalimonadaceae bacterium]|nr:ABC transporter permease [Catalimonadaceae bacterium]